MPEDPVQAWQHHVAKKRRKMWFKSVFFIDRLAIFLVGMQACATSKACLVFLGCIRKPSDWDCLATNGSVTFFVRCIGAALSASENIMTKTCYWSNWFWWEYWHACLCVRQQWWVVISMAMVMLMIIKTSDEEDNGSNNDDADDVHDVRNGANDDTDGKTWS